MTPPARASAADRWWFRCRVCLAAVLSSLLVACTGEPPARHRPLSPDLGPLRDRFNQDAGKVRVLIAVSPTSGASIRMASALQQRILARDPSTDLSVYVVWVPKQRAEEQHVLVAAGYLTDARAVQFWDAGNALGPALRRTLQLEEDGWELAMAYGGQAQWRGSDPPGPDTWMHQRGTKEQPRVRGRFWDSETFGQEVERLLERSSP